MAYDKVASIAGIATLAAENCEDWLRSAIQASLEVLVCMGFRTPQ